MYARLLENERFADAESSATQTEVRSRIGPRKRSRSSRRGSVPVSERTDVYSLDLVPEQGQPRRPYTSMVSVKSGGRTPHDIQPLLELPGNVSGESESSSSRGASLLALSTRAVGFTDHSEWSLSSFDGIDADRHQIGSPTSSQSHSVSHASDSGGIAAGFRLPQMFSEFTLSAFAEDLSEEPHFPSLPSIARTFFKMWDKKVVQHHRVTSVYTLAEWRFIIEGREQVVAIKHGNSPTTLGDKRIILVNRQTVCSMRGDWQPAEYLIRIELPDFAILKCHLGIQDKDSKGFSYHLSIDAVPFQEARIKWARDRTRSKLLEMRARNEEFGPEFTKRSEWSKTKYSTRTKRATKKHIVEWQFTIGPSVHSLRLENGLFSGKKKIVVDSEVVHSEKSFFQRRAFEHAFEIGNLPVEVEIKRKSQNSFSYAYDLRINGVSFDALMQMTDFWLPHLPSTSV